MVKCGNNFSALLQSGCAKICFVVRQTALYPSQMSRKLPLRYASNGRDSLNLKKEIKMKNTTPDAAVLQELKELTSRIFKIQRRRKRWRGRERDRITEAGGR